jgi:RNA polymerase sigma-70 factor, ECF subfamily
VPAEWELTYAQFQAALESSVAHRFGTGSSTESAAFQAKARTIASYLESLHVSDLALACACSNGGDAAWEFFMAQYRRELYRAACAICGAAVGDAAARELADSLYADLYGLRERDGRRKSLFDYFHGRSRLGTWLRAVLAQRYVDEIRRSRKTDSLEDESGAGKEILVEPTKRRSPSAREPIDTERSDYLAILQASLTAALAALAPRDRLRLAYYYADDLTLAQIGKLLGEQEATVSRKLERTRRGVRKHVETALRDRRKLAAEQIKLCLEYAQGEWPFDLTRALRAQGPQIQQPTEAGALSPD